uniref:Thioredoxin-like protein n=1 Tax=Kalanchoe fedtschenkoi TaxID=63787 RepID=A0A7N0ZZ80_KALFE
MEEKILFDKTEEKTFFDKMLSHLRGTCKYYTGYPKDLGPSRVIHFTSERGFVQLLHEGRPVVVAFTIRSNYSRQLDKVLEEAAAEFYPHVKFMRVECPKYPGFCITRQKKEYPFVEIFHSPEQANQATRDDPNVTKYSVKVLPFNYDQSPYGFREFFKRYGIKYSEESK